MKFTIIAATGGIGRRLVDQAVEAGHDVTAVARTPERVTAPVRVIGVDLANPDRAKLEAAVAGADAVLSGLGPTNSGGGASVATGPGVTTLGTTALVRAMTATGSRRLVVVSAAPVGTFRTAERPNPPRDPGDGPVTRFVAMPIIKRLLRRVYVDLAAMEAVLRDSGLEWTAVRPPRLTDKKLTGAYSWAYDRNAGGPSIGRADVAHLMLAVLDRPESIRRTVGIGG